MAIDIQREKLVNLTDAAKLLPAAQGKRIHISCLWRWCRNGVNGVRLEYVKVGPRMFTSHEALGRFVVAAAEADPPVASAMINSR